MGINYNAGTGNEKNWIIEETNYRPEYSGKFETIFSLGNGYMGSRSATEEAYACQRKGTFIAGLFNAFPEEVTELVNIPDWTNAEIYIRGERMNLLSGKVLHYSRRLNMKAGTVTRSFTWVSASGKETQFEFERFLSLADLHLAVLNIKIRPVNYSGDIQILSGIDGQQTNSGVQHFLDAALRHYENGSIGYTARTTASKETLYINSHCMVSSSGEIESTSHIQTDRRYIAQDIRVTAAEKQEFCFQKYTSFWTSRDREFIHEKDVSASVLMERGKKTINAAREKSFQELKKEHAIRWSRIWDRMDIQIEGPDFDQLGLRFSMFHMFQMAPVHDDRISIAAKGLSGEGYKGHVFWDAEIFNIPFYTYTFPEHACSLLTYRYNCLDGARRKARSNGWAGAMFPWESAATGDEVTPKWGAVDIKTGEPIRIWTGELEQHITCDVFYAMWMYCKITGDLQFFYSKFLEVMIETARYWVDRLEYDAETDVYEITGIIGPDEFGENVNNNGFTNYMVKWQLKKSFAVSENLFQNDSASWKQITEKLKLKRDEPLHWKELGEKLVFRKYSDTGVISQYDGFFDLPELDITNFKGRAGTIFTKYGWEEVIHSQVIKQADIVMLMYLMEEHFDAETRKANWDFYERRTLHDSSLSMGMHAAAGARMGEVKEAYRFFLRSLKIDLGENMKSSDPGLHAASLGGNWQAAVNGFAGIRVSVENGLSVTPNLPEDWKRITFCFQYRSATIQAEISHENILLTRLDSSDEVICLTVLDREVELSSDLPARIDVRP